MARGGFREGAGRKPGSANKRTREIADRAAEEGITPLEVMLRAMREFVEAGEMKEAADIAAKAAPYMHPRLATIDINSTVENVNWDVSAEPLTTEQWEAQHCQPTQ